MDGFNQTKYISEYKKAHYDKIVFHIPKGKKEVLKEAADRAGKSVTRLIIDSIEKQNHIDLTINESQL